MRNPLFAFESHLSSLVERLFSGRINAQTLMLALTRAFEDAISTAEDGQWVAPTCLTLHLHPLDFADINSQQAMLIRELGQYVHLLSQQHNATLNIDPMIEFVENSQQERSRIHVEMGMVQAIRHGTQQMPAADPEPEPLPPGACLLREGRVILQIERYVVNLGRHFDNHVVLDDHRVSRWHAQMRLRHGHYAIYDLNSTHGTYVNGARIVEHILQTGDVIQLGGVKLVYLEDDSTDHMRLKAGDTQTRRPIGLSETEN